MPFASVSPSADLKAQLGRLRDGDPFLAYDLASQATREWPGEVYFRHVQAHALARTGAPLAALKLLESLYEDGRRDAETLGLLGRVWKDLARLATSEREKRAQLERARAYYREGTESAEHNGHAAGCYPGINAAAISALLGDEDAARQLASRAAGLAAEAPREYWSVATLAEAALIARDFEKARTHFTEAQLLSPTPMQSASTRRQARLLAAQLLGRADAFDACFHVPPVVVFIGHLTDEPQRPSPRFPESLVPTAAANLRRRLAELGACVGYASAARGGDLLFHEALREAGGESRIVLPLDPEVFREVSVSGSDPAWEPRFDAALRHAQPFRIATNNSSTADGLAFEFGLRYLLGLAQLRARELDTPLRGLVLWDGTIGDGHGGTAWGVSHLLAAGIAVDNVFPGREGPVREAPSVGAGLTVDGRCLHALLFADCKGYSKLREEQITAYIRQLYTGVARLIARLDRTQHAAPLAANTWGDGLFLVFADVRAACHFAVALRDAVVHRQPEIDLPADVRLRIGLHAGPIQPFEDPITRRPGYVGSNITFAARIEPIADENQICASEPFAALTADAGLSEFHFEYLGLKEFGKGFGTYPLYQLRAARLE
jgi:class 3 adenylate cyclase